MLTGAQTLSGGDWQLQYLVLTDGIVRKNLYLLVTR
jgi:hypothetical protein